MLKSTSVAGGMEPLTLALCIAFDCVCEVSRHIYHEPQHAINQNHKTEKQVRNLVNLAWQQNLQKENVHVACVKGQLQVISGTNPLEMTRSSCVKDLNVWYTLISTRNHWFWLAERLDNRSSCIIQGCTQGIDCFLYVFPGH